MNLLQKPVITFKTFQNMGDMSWFYHALLFDDLLAVTQRETCCFVLNTADGLAVIDAIWPAREAFEAIIDAIRDVGWKPEDLRHLLLTHGHMDHTGCGRYLVEEYGVQTYLSRIDDQFWAEHPLQPERPETWKDYKISHYLENGDTLRLGGTWINAYLTPGHTPGCLSYIFPVTEEGRCHTAALWGGATPPRDRDGAVQYLRSLDRFLAEAERLGADVALTNHTAIDSGLPRMRYARERMACLPNPYVIGVQGFRQFCQVFRTMAYDVISPQ